MRTTAYPSPYPTPTPQFHDLSLWADIVYDLHPYETQTHILCVLDRASSWYLNKVRPTWWHLFYYVNLLLNMFQMDVLTSETCWAVNWRDKASAIKLVYLHSNKHKFKYCSNFGSIRLDLLFYFKLCRGKSPCWSGLLTLSVFSAGTV